MLDTNDRQALFRIARATIEAGLESREVSFNPESMSEPLRRTGGAFVTLTIGDALRGCIGTVVAVEPLYRSVSKNAANAAFKDPRFHPLSREEYQGVAIEISVMYPLEDVDRIESIEIGVHGLLVSFGGSSGLLLPQVASEHEWDRETFLRETCRKAGLGADTWRRPECQVRMFRAEVFSEQDFRSS